MKQAPVYRKLKQNSPPAPLWVCHGAALKLLSQSKRCPLIFRRDAAAEHQFHFGVVIAPERSSVIVSSCNAFANKVKQFVQRWTREYKHIVNIWVWVLWCLRATCTHTKNPLPSKSNCGTEKQIRNLHIILAFGGHSSSLRMCLFILTVPIRKVGHAQSPKHSVYYVNSLLEIVLLIWALSIHES